MRVDRCFGQTYNGCAGIVGVAAIFAKGPPAAACYSAGTDLVRARDVWRVSARPLVLGPLDQRLFPAPGCVRFIVRDFLDWLVKAVRGTLMPPPVLVPIPVTAPAPRRPADRD